MSWRSQTGSAGWWAWACVALVAAAGFELLLGGPWSRLPGYALGTIYAALVLAGALRYAGHPVPRWLLAGALGVGLVRGAAGVADQPLLAHGLSLVLEPLALLTGAVLVARSHGRGASIPQRLLPIGIVAVALLESATAVGLMAGGAFPDRLLRAWLAIAPVLLALQLVASGEATRRELERARAALERRVVEEEDRYRIVSELSSDYSFAYRLGPDGLGAVEWVTSAAETVTGYTVEDLEGGGWVRSLHPEDRPLVVAHLEALTRGSPPPRDSLDLRILTKSGEERLLHIRFSTRSGTGDGSVRIFGSARDVTEWHRAQQERRRLDAHLREMQRLESLGRLAGGIAHDFNNLLTVIQGNGELLLGELAPDDKERRRRVERIRSAARHAARLTEQILTYSGEAAVRLAPLDLSDLVRGVLDLLRASLGDKTVLGTELPDGLPAVEGDETQLRQVLLNLVGNASEAIGEGGGIVRVRAAVAEFSAQELVDAVGVPHPAAGTWVVLEVSDTGPGLDPSVRERVFEPFFSTKSTGRGVGLASALGIVRAHRGLIRVHSELGRGTRFQVLLPRSEGLAELVGEAETPVAASDAVRGRILVVDDDDDVVQVAREFLERAGFEVHCARSGAQAVALLRDDRDAIDAAVVDLVMPDLPGEQTLRALRELRPDLPAVLLSGYDRAQVGERFADSGVQGFVRKPYEPEELVEAVRAALSV